MIVLDLMIAVSCTNKQSTNGGIYETLLDIRSVS